MSEVCSIIAGSGLSGSLQSICRRAGFYNFGCGGLSLERRQRSEQYFTSLQFLAHFSLHAKGFPHVAHVFIGRSAFLTILAIWILSYSTCLRNCERTTRRSVTKVAIPRALPYLGKHSAIGSTRLPTLFMPARAISVHFTFRLFYDRPVCHV